MTNDEFVELASELWWDGRGWQKNVAKDMGVSVQTVSNWATGRQAVPAWVNLHIEKKQESI